MLIAYVNTGIDPGRVSQTPSATQLTTRSSTAGHMMLWFAFTMGPATWSNRTSTLATSKSC